MLKTKKIKGEREQGGASVVELKLKLVKIRENACM
jgi:hypothetical protein